MPRINSWWRSFIIGLVIIASIPNIVSPQPSYAQAPFEVVFGRVKEFLTQQIGRDFIVVEYTYELQTWPDASFGCPVPGVSYTQEAVQGFNWSITIDGGQALEVHSNTDGTSVVLCTPIDRSLLINYRSFQSEAFVVDYPETWQTVTDNLAYVAGFFPNGIESCDTAGMIVVQLEQFGSNANALLNETVKQAGLVQSLGIATPVGTNGLTITYQNVCDAVIRQNRATAFPLPDGTGGFVVIQFSSVAESQSWNDVFLSIATSFQLIGNLTSAGGDTTPEAEDLDPVKLIGGYALAHNFVTELYIGALGDIPGFRITYNETKDRQFSFSSDGIYVAYAEPEPVNEGRRIETVEGGTGRPTTVARGVTDHYPPAWSPDARILAYIKHSDDGENLEIHTVNANRQDDTLLGTLQAPADCEPAETVYVSEKLYWQESGPQGNHYTLAWLPDDRFLITAGCNGAGLVLWSANADSIAIVGENDVELRRAVISSDRVRAAALDADGNLYLIELMTGETSLVEIEAKPDQMAWSNDGKQLFYTTLTQADSVTVDDEAFASRGENLLKVYPYESIINDLTINALNLESGQSTVLWQGQGYAVGRLVPAPNGIGLLFTLVPSDREFIDGFRRSLSYEELRFLLPETVIYWLPPNGGMAQLIMYSSQPVLAPVLTNSNNQ